MIKDKDGDTIELKRDINGRIIVQIREGSIYASVSLTKEEMKQFIDQALGEIKI